MNRFSILVVDDNDVDRELLRRDLEKAGLDVVMFEKANGKDALNFFRNHTANRTFYPADYPPLITFLDINMPVMDGFRFLENFGQVRSELDFDPGVVMIFTTSEDEQDKEKALSYDFVVDYLIKGKFDPVELRKKILYLVEQAA